MAGKIVNPFAGGYFVNFALQAAGTDPAARTGAAIAETALTVLDQGIKEAAATAYPLVYNVMMPSTLGAVVVVAEDTTDNDTCRIRVTRNATQAAPLTAGGTAVIANSLGGADVNYIQLRGDGTGTSLLYSSRAQRERATAGDQTSAYQNPAEAAVFVQAQKVFAPGDTVSVSYQLSAANNITGLIVGLFFTYTHFSDFEPLEVN